MLTFINVNAAPRVVAANHQTAAFGSFDPLAGLHAGEDYGQLRALRAVDSAEGQAFALRFKQRFQTSPTEDAARAYVAAELLTTAIRSASQGAALPPRAAVASQLRSRVYGSFLGPLRFDQHGNLAQADFLLVRQARTLARCAASI
jgi:hypothetical protein